VSKRSRVELPPEFFVDRSLGSQIVPARLRAEGLIVHTTAEVYPDREDVDDDIWIPECTDEGWVLLTKDKAIRRNQAEKEAVQRSAARMFCIPSGNMTGPEMAERLARNRHRIIQHARKYGPYIYAVQHDRLDLVFPLG
jgi:PIN like domain